MKTVNLELSKQLKEQGYPQEGYFIWTLMPNDLYLEHPNSMHHELMPAIVVNPGSIVSPTADEILERLPSQIETEEYIYTLEISKLSNQSYYIKYDCQGRILEREVEVSFADAAARMWLYLKKEGLL